MIRRITAVASVTALALAAAGIATAGVAGAAGGTSCTDPGGTAKVSPGFTAKPKVQNVIVKGTLAGCSGGNVTGAKFLLHLKTSASTCADVSAGTFSVSGTQVIKWNPKGHGNSRVSITVTGTGANRAHLAGTVAKGRFKGLALSTDVSLTPVFKPGKTPCTNSNTLKRIRYTATSPVAIS